MNASASEVAGVARRLYRVTSDDQGEVDAHELLDSMNRRLALEVLLVGWNLGQSTG